MTELKCSECTECPNPGIYRCYDCKGWVCEEHARTHFPMPARKHWEEEKQRMWAQGVTWMREKAQYRILLAELRKELEEIKTMLKEKP